MIFNSHNKRENPYIPLSERQPIKRKKVKDEVFNFSSIKEKIFPKDKENFEELEKNNIVENPFITPSKKNYNHNNNNLEYYWKIKGESNRFPVFSTVSPKMYNLINILNSHEDDSLLSSPDKQISYSSEKPEKTNEKEQLFICSKEKTNLNTEQELNDFSLNYDKKNEDKLNNENEQNESIQNLKDKCKEKDREINTEPTNDELIKTKQKLEELESKYRELENSYISEKKDLGKALEINEKKRKNLHNFLQNIRGNIRIYCRIKPETDNNIKSCFKYIENNETTDNIININRLELVSIKGSSYPNNIYYFDKIFHQSTQKEVFFEIIPFIQSAIDGDNVSIFAYGPTGTGKTYTIKGVDSQQEQDIIERSGILPRVSEFIFSEIKNLNNIGIQKQVFFSAFEIYNENIYDLLDNKKTPLKILVANKVEIKDLIWKEVKCKEDLLEQINLATDSRICESTKYNQNSSRSHAIFQIRLSKLNKLEDNIISIIDLAGSERNNSNILKSPQIEKTIQTESNFINKSLTTLGRVVKAIRDRNYNISHIPYRDSKLTMVLQSILNPNSKTAIIITVNSNIESLSVTKETLNFSKNFMKS